MRVLIADDHVAITMVLSRMVQERVSEFAKVEVYHDGDALLAALGQGGEPIGLAILDMTMPGAKKRVQLLREVLRIEPDLRVLVYSASEEPLQVLAALNAGARGYVCKGSSYLSVVDAFEAILSGGVYVDERVDLVAAARHPWQSLTESEREVFVILAKGLDLTVAAEATGRSYKTVATHKYNAMRKLGLGRSAPLATYLHDNGLNYELDA